MRMNKRASFKHTVYIITPILGLVAIVLFVFAILCKEEDVDYPKETSNVRVYINQNDSSITRIQDEIIMIRSIFEQFDIDSISSSIIHTIYNESIISIEAIDE